MAMRDLTPFNRRHRGFGGHSNARRKRLGYPTFVACCALLAVLVVLNPEKMPASVQTLVAASHDLERERSPIAGAYYPNCDAARAAGVAPIYRGEPGYREPLDADDDGIACEPYRN